MKAKNLIICTVIFSASLAANAQLLWRVTPPGGGKSSCIFGTHHCAPTSLTSEIPGFDEAFNQAEKVYGEIDMSVMSKPENMMLMQQALMAPADSTLSRVFLPTQLDSIKSVAQAYFGPIVDMSQFDMLKPAALMTTLAQLMAQRATGHDMLTQLDAVIQQRAVEAGKEVGGLETLTTQLNLLFGAPITEQADQLMFAIRNHDKLLEISRILYQAYRDGNLDELYRIITDESAGYNAENGKALITDRNNAWVDFLLGLLPAASIMVVVGAGHLAGDDGLIPQLRSHGYKVEPYTSDSK